MLLVLASENRHKTEEITTLLKEGMDITVETLAAYPGIKLPPEVGSTYSENAAEKARFVAKKTGHWAMGDDSGLEVRALDGVPGLLSARYAGEGVSYEDNLNKLLGAMKDIPEGKRQARFICTIAIASPLGEVNIGEGTCEGEITVSQSGQDGFGYDPIFFYPPAGLTFAELSPTEKSVVSHRGRALKSIIAILKAKATKGSSD
ncbi:RdgB/HAM1 family non-canonical purine NTP pyrophosphatase [Nitrospira defluvii]|nr:RdgB/HAM1 family non-canonical purine NTP pyrophosphatase [Nitrospira defluvii]